MSKRNYFLDYVMCMLFPNRCKFCDRITDVYEDICEDCRNELPFIDGEICENCGALKSDCNCKKRSQGYFERVVSPLYYSENVENCISRFKFGDEKNIYRCLAELMADTCKERYKDIRFDYIAYVPMSKRKQRRRGYNQSQLLAQELADILGIEFGEDMLVKLYDTDNQHDCSAVERKGNLLGVFDVDEKYNVDGKNILLVDDIKTSGSTLSECGKMLYLNGAEGVFCLTAALRNSTIKDNEE